MEHQKILILDFGGQYNQLIARRVREQNVYCDLLPYDMTVEKIREYDPIGIIFTGGPNSVYADNAPNVKKEIFDLGIPVLGICYGCQLIAYKLGGKIIARETVKAVRKDVLAKCYGGDITRKKKLLEKQKEGKKRMRSIGSVEVPSEVFMSILKTNK